MPTDGPIGITTIVGHGIMATAAGMIHGIGDHPGPGLGDRRGRGGPPTDGAGVRHGLGVLPTDGAGDLRGATIPYGIIPILIGAPVAIARAARLPDGLLLRARAITGVPEAAARVPVIMVHPVRNGV